MKRTLSIVSLVLFVLAQGLTACAEATPRQTLTSGNFRYILQDDDTAIITGYFGNDEKLSIPNQLAGHTVVAIGDEAFFDCDIGSVRSAH